MENYKKKKSSTSPDANEITTPIVALSMTALQLAVSLVQ